eukprot:TRINITY_DN11014_c0_g1_i1.p1 TRINITY_DN11014_c0_g1~~TRINITY_DN11014_c0_g1_i1.p1  ORF type:complete len:1316 (-),score=349.92 TRINITY_DN11014_c0_g1_i1:5-3898(-)
MATSEGRFAKTFQEYQLGGEEERRELEEKEKRIQLAKAKSQLSRALHDGHVEEAVQALEELIDSGEKPANDTLQRLVTAAADSPDALRFARVINAVTRGGIKFDEHAFATLIGKLISSEAPHAMVRCALNFGLEAENDVIELIPSELREEEKDHAFIGATNDDTGELDADLNGLDVAAPALLEFSGCVKLNALNGIYQRRQGRQDLLGHSRPIYEKRKGLMTRYCVYYWDASLTKDKDASSWESGWYLGSEVGGGGRTYARCITKGTSSSSTASPEEKAKSQAEALPPAAGSWEVQANIAAKWTSDAHSGFRAPTSRMKQMQALSLTEQESKDALQTVNLEALRASVTGRDPEVTKYFCHFFILLALELMTEIANYRSRWNFRNEKALVSFGIAFSDMKVLFSSTRDDRARVSLPGWESFGAEEVTFRLPGYVTDENCRFKAGEQIIISRGDPLRRFVCEGSVKEIDFRARLLICSIGGKMPEDPWRTEKFRIDQYANRTTYERQVHALLQFITMERNKMFDMLVVAGVGKLDEAVAEEAKLMRRRRERAKTGFKTKAQLHLEAADKEELKEKKKSALANWDDDNFFVDEEKKAEQSEAKQKERAEQAKKLAEMQKQIEQEALVAEQIKVKTNALAEQDVEGVDPEHLEIAKATVSKMENTSDAQKDAITSSMSKRLTIVQGPPGTGKTHTSVRILTNWVKIMNYRPLLATSECNVAVDNIAEGLVANGIKVVRIGRPEKVSVRLAQCCLSNLVEEGLQKQVEEGDEDYDDDEDCTALGDEPEDWHSTEWRDWQRKRDKLQKRKVWIRQRQKFIRQRILEEAEVICATTIASGSPQLEGYSFRGILIDEVAQATETSCIVPIVCRGAQQLVLCGDHCQLPPSVLSREAELRGYSLSLYSRLTMAGVPFRFLDTQYRAHPQLMEFSAAEIYSGKLKNGIQGSQRPRPEGVPWIGLEAPALFMESGVEEHLEGESKANRAEALVVQDLVQRVIDKGDCKITQIGIVTPYKGQVRVLRKMLHLEAGLKVPEGYSADQLEIASVDNFQGREKELIVFSAVRCNTIGSVGFLKDWRRLNVMITRARRGLVVIGNAMTLVNDDFWKKWLECTEKQGGALKGTVKKAMAANERGDPVIPAAENEAAAICGAATNNAAEWIHWQNEEAETADWEWEKLKDSQKSDGPAQKKKKKQSFDGQAETSSKKNNKRKQEQDSKEWADADSKTDDWKEPSRKKQSIAEGDSWDSSSWQSTAGRSSNSTKTWDNRDWKSDNWRSDNWKSGNWKGDSWSWKSEWSSSGGQKWK